MVHKLDHRLPPHQIQQSKMLPTTTRPTEPPYSRTPRVDPWLQNSSPKYGGATATELAPNTTIPCMTCGPVNRHPCTRPCAAGGFGTWERCPFPVCDVPPQYATSRSHPAQPWPMLLIPFGALYCVQVYVVVRLASSLWWEDNYFCAKLCT